MKAPRELLRRLREELAPEGASYVVYLDAAKQKQGVEYPLQIEVGPDEASSEKEAGKVAIQKAREDEELRGSGAFEIVKVEVVQPGGAGYKGVAQADMPSKIYNPGEELPGGGAAGDSWIVQMKPAKGLGNAKDTEGEWIVRVSVAWKVAADPKDAYGPAVLEADKLLKKPRYAGRWEGPYKLLAVKQSRSGAGPTEKPWMFRITFDIEGKGEVKQDVPVMPEGSAAAKAQMSLDEPEYGGLGATASSRATERLLQTYGSVGINVVSVELLKSKFRCTVHEMTDSEDNLGELTGKSESMDVEAPDREAAYQLTKDQLNQNFDHRKWEIQEIAKKMDEDVEDMLESLRKKVEKLLGRGEV